MVQFQILPETTQGRLGREMGAAFGQGMSQIGERIGQQKQAGILSRVLSGEASPEEAAQLSPEYQLKAATLQQQQRLSQQKAQEKQQIELEKQQREQQEAAILAKQAAGEELTPQEMARLSPTSLRTLIGQERAMFEPEEEKLEAKRVSELATQIENEYKAYQSEELRLGRMGKLSEKGEVSTPLMVTALNAMGLPLGVLGNPDTEEYSKLEADFLRDVRNVFPGGRITNFEIQSYMKTVPSLMNSKEGKKAIIRNRRLMNEAKKLRYDAYREILKENKGRKPRNLGNLIEDKIGGRLAAIENEFREGIQNEIERFQQPLRMVGPDGNAYNVPANLIEKALQDGMKFQ